MQELQDKHSEFCYGMFSGHLEFFRQTNSWEKKEISFLINLIASGLSVPLPILIWNLRSTFQQGTNLQLRHSG